MRRALVVLAVFVSAAACQGGDPPTPVTSRLPSFAAAGCPVPAVAPVDPRSVLVPGPTGGLPTSPARGEAMIIVAVVLEPSCRPAAGATVHLWHTDTRGLYRPAGTDVGNYYEGDISADQNGRFRLESIRPAQYPEPGAPPAHIHLGLRHGSGQLNGEIVFTTNPAPVTAVRPSRTVPVFLRQQDGAFYGEAAFVLQ